MNKAALRNREMNENVKKEFIKTCEIKECEDLGVINTQKQHLGVSDFRVGKDFFHLDPFRRGLSVGLDRFFCSRTNTSFMMNHSLSVF